MVRHETEQVVRRNFGLHKYLTVKPGTKSISDVQGLISDTKTDNSAYFINPLKPELNPICYLLALLGAHHFLHVSRIRVKLLTLR